MQELIRPALFLVARVGLFLAVLGWIVAQWWLSSLAADIGGGCVVISLCPQGLIAGGGDLSTSRLLAAYRAGIFPWFDEPPILWWSPDPRSIVTRESLHVSRSLRRTLRKTGFHVTRGRDLAGVMRACADLAAGASLRCLVSLENTMACGFGVCLGCAAPRAEGGFSLVCKAGPVFEASEIAWEGLP